MKSSTNKSKSETLQNRPTGSIFGFVPSRLAIEGRPELNIFPLNVLFVQYMEKIGETVWGSAEPVVFKVSGKRTGNLLGFLPVSADVETQVGAQTGQILTTTQPLWFQLLGPLVR